MLGQLRENQLALMHSQPQLVIETPKRPRHPKQSITLLFNEGYTPEFWDKYKEYDLPSADVIMNMRTEEEKDGLVKRLSSAQSSMGGKKRMQTRRGIL